ncbi:MAG: hypothetical protein ACNA8P_04240, partial [Phycisphaerales bacterium]
DQLPALATWQLPPQHSVFSLHLSAQLLVLLASTTFAPLLQQDSPLLQAAVFEACTTTASAFDGQQDLAEQSLFTTLLASMTFAPLLQQDSPLLQAAAAFEACTTTASAFDGQQDLAEQSLLADSTTFAAGTTAASLFLPATAPRLQQLLVQFEPEAVLETALTFASDFREQGPPVKTNPAAAIAPTPQTVIRVETKADPRFANIIRHSCRLAHLDAPEGAGLKSFVCRPPGGRRSLSRAACPGTLPKQYHHRLPKPVKSANTCAFADSGPGGCPVTTRIAREVCPAISKIEENFLRSGSHEQAR